MPEWPGREPIEDALVGVCAQTPPSQSAMKQAVSTAVKHSREYKLLVHYIFKFLLACDTNEKVCGRLAPQVLCCPSLSLCLFFLFSALAFRSRRSTLTSRTHFALMFF